MTTTPAMTPDEARQFLTDIGTGDAAVTPYEADDVLNYLRELIMAEGDEGAADMADLDVPDDIKDRLVVAYGTLLNVPYSTDMLSHLAMDLDLCPVHRVDWAICFDDEDPECAQVRSIFPHSHST